MEEKLNDLMKDNKVLQTNVDGLSEVRWLNSLNQTFATNPLIQKQEFDYSHVKKEAMKTVDDYNRLLNADLRSQNNF